LFLRRKKAIMPTAMSTTAAPPMAIPAIAPPPNLFEPDDETGADVEVCAATDVEDVEDEDVEEVEGEVVEDEEAVEVDWTVELPSPPGCRFW
jgi:hypothetical protein